MSEINPFDVEDPPVIESLTIQRKRLEAVISYERYKMEEILDEIRDRSAALARTDVNLREAEKALKALAEEENSA